MKAKRIVYTATPTLSRFHRSAAKVRGVRGPVGSGKSTGMSAEITIRANQQAPSPIDNISRTRFAVVRNTYRELEDTTLKTWMDWFEPAGEFNYNDMAFYFRERKSENGRPGFQCEVLFRALDRPKDVKKLLSMELTGIWFNEAREIPKSIIDAADDRIGRYPAVREGGCTWRGVMMDTNSPDQDHWWYRLAEEQRPEGWEFFAQPGGIIEVDGQFLPNPMAENIPNLEPGYYISRVPGKSLDHIRVFYCNQYGFVIEGRPVIPEYRDALHCAAEIIKPVPGLPIHVGIDWGLTPAAVFMQRLANGRWIAVHEITTEHMGAKNFGKLFAAHCRENFMNFRIVNPMTADPSGESDAPVDEDLNMFKVFNAALRDEKIPLSATPCVTQDPVLRHGSLGSVLSTIIDGKPGFMVSPACKMLRKGLAGGYC